MTVFDARGSSSVRTLRADDDPQWLRLLVFVPAAAVAAFGSVGLLLAVLGWYRRLAVLGGGVVVLAALCACARPLFPRRGTASRNAHVVAVVAVVAVAGITIWNAANASHQVLIIRDGGTYLNAGKWISGHGSLEVRPFTGPFTADSGLAASSAGMNRRGDHLDFTLAHLFPALLAEAQGLGGDGLMYTAVSLLGGLALLAFYLLARCVLLHPIAALGATLCLGLTMPQVAFSRDSTTEIPMQVLLFTAVWLLCDTRTLRRLGPAFVAGFFLGLLQAIHIDGLAFVVGLPFVVAVAWLRAPAPERRRVLAAGACAAGGVLLGVALAFFDLLRRSSHYLRSLRFDVQRLSATVVVAVVAAAAFVAAVRWWTHRADAARRPAWPSRVSHPAGWVAASVVLVGGFGAWFVRPRLQTIRSRRASTLVGLVQHANHLRVDPTRRYFEHSLQWVVWYLGPITVTLAIVGASYATLIWVRGRLKLSAQVAALVLAPPALLYLWRPSITPDHVWVMRRFLPAILPLFVLIAFGVLNLLAERRVLGRALGAWDGRRSLALALGVAAVAYPAYTIRNVTQMTQQRGFETAVTRVCNRIGPRGAVIVPQEAAPLTWYYDPQTLRSFCNVPVAIMGSGQSSALAPQLNDAKLSPAELRALAREWAAQGRRLFVVATNRSTINSLVRHARPRVVSVRRTDHLLEQTLVRRPDSYQPERLLFLVAPVPMR